MAAWKQTLWNKTNLTWIDVSAVRFLQTNQAVIDSRSARKYEDTMENYGSHSYKLELQNKTATEELNGNVFRSALEKITLKIAPTYRMVEISWQKSTFCLMSDP